jgi:hypothetical protein
MVKARKPVVRTVPKKAVPKATSVKQIPQEELPADQRNDQIGSSADDWPVISEGNQQQANYFDRMEKARSARLAYLDGDKLFFEETRRIQNDLKEVLNNYPGTFERFFQSFSELSVRLESVDLDQFLEKMPQRAREILLDYIAYARRFRVWFTWQKGAFRIWASGPWQQKFRAKVADGFLREIDPEAPGVEVIENQRYVDDDLTVPTPELEKLLGSGRAKFFQLEDQSGKSILHQIEEIAYEPESITFIRHKSSRDYLFCLVGENVPIDSLWREAGKVANSLQSQLYGRKRVGRPPKLEKWKKAIGIRERQNGAPLKESAGQLLGEQESSAANFRSAQVFLSKSARKIAPKQTKK